MSTHQDSDISLKEFILKIQEYLSALMKSWKFITFMGFLFAFIFFAWKFDTKPMFKADLTFMLNEDESGSLGGLSALIGQFGFSTGSTESNLDKILHLSKARAVTQKTLFDSISLNNRKDYVANHLIESFKYLNIWKAGRLSKLIGEDEYNIDDFMFTHSDVKSFTLTESKALKKIHGLLAGNKDSKGFFSSDYSELTGVMEFSVLTADPELSIILINNLYDKLSKYYIEKSVEKQEHDYNVIKSKYDSITVALNSVQNRLAYFQDSNRNLFRKQDMLVENKLRIEEQKLFTLYAEAEKQKQIAELTLNNKTPYIDLIDSPLGPLKPANAGRFFYFLLGGFLGGLFACSIVIVRKIYHEIMNS